MQSRENFKKNNKRNDLYLIMVGLVLIAAIIGGVLFYNHHTEEQAKAKQFATTHFNPNAKIDGVKVGNLTVASAVKKVNTKASNYVVFEKGKVSLQRDPAITTITESAVKSAFAKQHTEFPNSQSYHYDSKTLTAAKKRLTKLSTAKVTYQVAGENYTLAAKTLINQLIFKNGSYQFTNTDDLTKKINQMDKAVTTLHQSYKVKVPVKNKVNGKTITVKNETYGWGINTKKAIAAVEQAFLNNTAKINGQDYIYGLGYSTYGLGYGEKNNGIGSNYIVVSLSQQEMWLVKNDKLVMHLKDVVTGTKDNSKGKQNQTPQGVWYLHYKKHHAILRGRNNDGSKYASPVNYWMPFTLSGCGLHDAGWRTDWSKKAYLRGGSHGCVNIKSKEIKQVWHNVAKHEPVIIYN